MAVPANIRSDFLVQDTNGYKALTGYAGTMAAIDVDLGAAGTVYGLMATVATAYTALTNGKIVRQSITFEFDLAQRPTNSPALYPNVNQRALMRFGDGNGQKVTNSIFAPVASMFVATAPDRGLVVDPAVTAVGTYITAVEALYQGMNVPINEFNGGQLVGGKPRRRRVVLGS